MSQVLIIEDNRAFATGLRSTLESEGFGVTVAEDGASGLRHAHGTMPDLLVLDLMLPDRSGYDVLRRLRDEGNDVPVLILTARRDEQDKLRCFGLGADDYVTKPVGLLELIERIRAVLRRSQPSGTTLETWVTVGDIAVHPPTHDVRRAGQSVDLRPKEYDLLVALLRHRGRIMSREALLREVWGYHPDTVSRTVDMHILALRQKLERDPVHPRYIRTARTAGYYLSA